MIKILSYLAFILLPIELSAQILIKGSVANQRKEPISYATISAGFEDSVITTIRSDQNGQFELLFKSNQSQKITWIEAKHIAFIKSKLDYKLTETNYDFILSKKTVQIEDVIVKSRPRAVRSAGDTTRYNVESFVSAEDRNIGDVLKRMPGVEVDENGVVKHNGKTVNRMYIDGDQLFQNGYGIGTRTIQPKSVKNVEIINNHEHKKVKHGVSNSEDVALNLVLTEDARLAWSGESQIGLAAPIDAYLNVNAMSFKKKYKSLNSLQYNSIGESISNDVEEISSYNIIEPLAASAPNVPINKYYQNRSFAFNTNQLYKFSEVWNTSINANIWADKQSLTSNNSLTYFSNTTKQITFNNYFNTAKKPFYGKIKLTIEGNHEKYFLKNTLSYTNQKQNHYSWLLDNNIRYDQTGEDQKNHISESFEYIPKLKNKDLLSFTFNLGKTWHQDQLIISPGILIKEINKNSVYEKLDQNLSLPQTYGNINLTYTKNKNRLKSSYFITGSFQQKQLISALAIYNNDLIYQSDNLADNDLTWRKKSIQAGTTFELKNRNFNFSATLPLSLNVWTINDPTNETFKKETTKLQVNPFLLMRYYLRNRDHFIFTARKNRSESDINEMYKNPLVTNYREINSYNAPLYFIDNSSFEIRYNLERPIKLLYAHISASYQHRNNDYLITRNISEQGFITSLVPFSNTNSSSGLNFGLSKSFLSKGIFTGLNGSVMNNKGYRIINDEVMNTDDLNFSIAPRIEYKKIKNTSLTYTCSYNQFYNSRKSSYSSNSNNYNSQTHNFSALYVLKSQLFIKGIWNYNSIKSDDFTPVDNGFIDLNVRYKPRQSKHSFQVDIINVLNKKVYFSNNLDAYSESWQIMPLRGMQAILKYSFLL